MSKIHPRTEKYLWLWSGVGVVMAALLGLWIYTLPQRINLAEKTGVEKSLWEQNSQELNKVWQDNSAALEKTRQFAKLYQNALAAVISGFAAGDSAKATSSPATLTPEQLQKIKQQLESK